jgi:hypothetical protein
MDKQAKAAAIKVAMSALRWVSSRCDGAVSLDGQGFSGTDSALGNALAEKSVWSPAETQAALRLIIKYQRQIDQAGLSRQGLDELGAVLAAERGKDAPRLQRRDVVKGTIWVDVDASRIVLKTGYHAELVPRIRELIGRQWDAAASRWTCSLCAENAFAVQELAERWGLELRKRDGWERLTPVRKVSEDGRWLRIDGVNARAVVKSLPTLRGEPEVDERAFGAIRASGDGTIMIPLRSWVIRDARLWFEALPEEQVPRLAWACEEVTAILDSAYPRAVKEERSLYLRASAAKLEQAERETLAARLPAALSTQLMPHQWVAVQALVQREQCLLADEQGLGKSVEILASLEATCAFPAVVVVPATAILNWRDEAAHWLPHRKVAVAGGGVGKKDQGVPFEAADIVVLNYESFDKHAAELAKLQPRALVTDEGQYLKTHDSARTQAVKAFCTASEVGRVMVATGTPVLNRPSELLTLLTLLPELLAELGGFVRFASRYCAATQQQAGWQSFMDFSGSDNLGELANRLRESGRFIRREKASVLPTLPEKQREEVSIEIANRAEYDLARQDLAAWLKTKGTLSGRQKKAKDEGEAAALRATAEWMGWSEEDARDMTLDTADRSEALRRVGALRQLAGVGKIVAAAEWIKRVVKDEKLVVFAFHIDVQRALAAALDAAGTEAPLQITGEMSAKARHAAIRAFQQDEKHRVIVCSLSAARTAITLTAAKRALIVELDWSPAALEQAEDRVHRIGQAGQVTITYLRGTDTLDDRMLSILDRKRAVIRKIASGDAPYGFKADGTPRKRPAGPGRTPLENSVRNERRKSSRARWQTAHPEYARDYMRARRLAKRVERAKRDIDDHKQLQRLGFEVIQREMGGRSAYSRKDYEAELQRAAAKADAARVFLVSNGLDVRDPEARQPTQGDRDSHVP